MTIEEKRQKFNGKVKNLVNKLTPTLANYNLGLGNLLTMNINFRKTGAIVGAVGTWYGLYSLYKMSPDLQEVSTILAGLNATMASMIIVPFISAIGYFMGNSIDLRLGDDSKRICVPKWKIEQEIEEIKAKRLSKLEKRMQELKQDVDLNDKKYSRFYGSIK
ncbi:MAG: hypothetical protein KKB39_04480 [Nanoarchaeota archaeon]|nr:hypothetical protein [Nanoarchaeota archaeon]